MGYKPKIANRKSKNEKPQFEVNFLVNFLILFISKYILIIDSEVCFPCLNLLSNVCIFTTKPKNIKYYVFSENLIFFWFCFVFLANTKSKTCWQSNNIGKQFFLHIHKYIDVMYFIKYIHIHLRIPEIKFRYMFLYNTKEV